MSKVDFAVFGSTPFAALLAICLAETHGKSVCLVGDIPNALQLTRGMDLEVGPYTRPETWALLAANKDESQHLLSSMGDVLTRTDVAFPANSPAYVHIAGHVRHMMTGFGQATEPLVDAHGQSVPGFMLRGVLRLQRRRFFAALPDRLGVAGITLKSTGAPVSLPKRGGVKIGGENGQEEIAVDRAILADDAAAMRHGDDKLLARFAQSLPMSALLTEPYAHLAWQSIIDLEHGGEAYTHPNGAIECAARRDAVPTRHWLAQQMAPNTRARLAGRALFHRLESHDGASIVGATNDNSPFHALGLGPAALFMAPAVIRYMLGTIRTEEAYYFDQRGVKQRGAHIVEPKSISAEMQT